MLKTNVTPSCKYVKNIILIITLLGLHDVCLLREPGPAPLEVWDTADVRDEVQTSEGGGRPPLETSQGDEKDGEISECV